MRNWLEKLNRAMARFMAGRYGMDKLNSVLLWTSVILVFVAMFMPWVMLRLGLTVLSYLIMGWAVYRTFSRQTYKRYQENCRFLRLMDRKHRYFDCPRCHQTIRVPRGKGKIAITCPKCREKFIKRT